MMRFRDRGVIEPIKQACHGPAFIPTFSFPHPSQSQVSLATHPAIPSRSRSHSHLLTRKTQSAWRRQHHSKCPAPVLLPLCSWRSLVLAPSLARRKALSRDRARSNDAQRASAPAAGKAALKSTSSSDQTTLCTILIVAPSAPGSRRIGEVLSQSVCHRIATTRNLYKKACGSMHFSWV